MASTLKVNTIQHTGGTSGMTIDSGGRVTMPTRPAFACHLETTVALDGNNGWGATSGSNSLSSGSWNWQITHGGYNIGGHHNLSTTHLLLQSLGYMHLLLHALWLVLVMLLVLDLNRQEALLVQDNAG